MRPTRMPQRVEVPLFPTEEYMEPWTTGQLKPVLPGILEGIITFPIHGDIPVRMERRANDRHGECAQLYIQSYAPSDGQLVLIQDIDFPDFWHGVIPVLGYWYTIRVEPKTWTIHFIDAIQPLPAQKWDKVEVMGSPHN